MDIISRIEANYLNLTRQERKVAARVTQDPRAVQRMTISTLAKVAGVSNATITRFVRHMDCADFYDFKLQLAAAAVDSAIVPPVTGASAIEDQVYAWYQKVLQDTWQQLDISTLTAFVQLIRGARRVYVYGLGSSGYTASELASRAVRMGIAAFAVTDSHMLFINSELVAEQDVVLALSASGNTQEVTEATAMAKAKGATTLCITGFANSPLGQQCDHALVVKSSRFVENERFFNQQLAMVYAVDVLTNHLLALPAYRKRLTDTVDQMLKRQPEY